MLLVAFSSESNENHDPQDPTTFVPTSHKLFPHSRLFRSDSSVIRFSHVKLAAKTSRYPRDTRHTCLAIQSDYPALWNGCAARVGSAIPAWNCIPQVIVNGMRMLEGVCQHSSDGLEKRRFMIFHPNIPLDQSHAVAAREGQIHFSEGMT